MTAFFDHHRPTLEAAREALFARGFWSIYPEVPSGRIYGETAKAEGESAFAALLGQPFTLPGHPEDRRLGAELSPFGPELGIAYPAADPARLLDASQAAAPALADAGPEARVGACLEILARLNRLSFLIANATMHTTGQAFAMAFQAGGPHAQDRGLEAVVMAWDEMTRFPAAARWEKPQGKAAPIVMDKHWTLVPAGIALTIGCNTFPTWNSYPGIFASLATGNPVIVKPHPAAILPLALTVRIAREVLAEVGLPADAILLAVDAPGAEITKTLATDQAVRLIDYTGSNAFGDWLRAHARQAQIFAEEAGVNTVTIAASPDFAAMCDNLAFSLALYSGQMCTAPQNIYVPKGGIETDQGRKSLDEVSRGIADAIDRLLADPARAAGVAGAIANSATLARLAEARKAGRILRDSAPLPEGRSATPLLLAVEAGDPAAAGECFGPVAFVVACEDADDAIARAAAISAQKGAITAALYDTDEDRIARAIRAFARAGANLSINLTGNIYVNQSAAFSDFHVTGANPAGNASLTDTAFVATRFRRVMWRRQVAA
ncbi:phenylacetic acid degradation protein PaaN [Paracoccus siganidrum]|uniref:Phenylacetic acid degradation protein PaaN n=1 Tax=Paracoccus siganidrum TaxID=1276757 RepID=A0A419ABC3_9RHOB|nr:phenylacetic acid degradation protein PaaN [Paracoccus siganidrum]RJL20740.1 phenylacetic acid degradation protein PaaN [Paracoccus siganidrum]RMC31952.1 phenylacetic acid degradation protein PaaN [Paracoccus siganidrum]